MDFITEYYGSYLSGTGITIGISFIALFVGFFVGLIACIARISNSKILRFISGAYIEIIRDTPLLVQLSLIAFGLPTIGINFPSIFGLSPEFSAGAFALTLNSGAYIAEIMRSGIQAVNKGQMEASRSLGLNYWQSMRHVIVPQAIKNILPALANEFVTLVKESSIVSFVGITDLMFISNSIKNSTYNAFGPYIFAALIYFIITFTLSKLVGVLEKKMSTDR
ncbi:amino acid ABC transporter permease [Peptostreptococcus equinus]|uniref:Amino acid ABC transporter permease n=1 Tax=Peptostreptococcus equinus TaxID=3003601 RepID=A0ABY7JTF6_9FIRM|nr:amino acid ABC transporter permease [Peptostreptococcus sp. CBA3647]WAW15197.1 amino acid ABC transporter permease [Peptostreptococcus sp. CBA3647]